MACVMDEMGLEVAGDAVFFAVACVVACAMDGMVAWSGCLVVHPVDCVCRGMRDAVGWRWGGVGQFVWWCILWVAYVWACATDGMVVWLGYFVGCSAGCVCEDMRHECHERRELTPRCEHNLRGDLPYESCRSFALPLPPLPPMSPLSPVSPLTARRRTGP